MHAYDVTNYSGTFVASRSGYTRGMFTRARLHAIVLAAISALLAVSLCGCFGGGAPTIHLEPYFNMSGFTMNGDRWEYHTDNASATKTGVDVSDHQDWIDWQAVAEDGIEFAMIRVGYRGVDEGLISPDAYFEYNIAATREAGIERGVYFFSQATSVEEAEEEARFVLDMLGGEPLEYPVAFDFETVPAGVSSPRAADVTPEEFLEFADAFCDVIEAAGYDTIIYGNESDMRWHDEGALNERPVWLARYGDPPTRFNPYRMWQYSNNGSVAGIDAAVDMNLDLSSAIA